jgi:hypothetical protein
VAALNPETVGLNRAVDRSVQNTAAIKDYVREELGHYAAKRQEDVRNYSGTGMISCYDAGGLSGTAQLVRKKGTSTKNIIITAAHNLFNDFCELVDIRNCYFTPLFAPHRKIPVSVAHENIGGCLLADNAPEKDWAIMELSKDVRVARPYLVPDQPIQWEYHKKLTQVSAFADNFPSTSGHAVDCETRENVALSDDEFVTTCSSGHGTSGSALIEKKRGSSSELEYWLYGISVYVPVGAIDNTEFSTVGFQNFTGGAPLAGRFFERLDAVLREHLQVRR